MKDRPLLVHQQHFQQQVSFLMSPIQVQPKPTAAYLQDGGLYVDMATGNVHTLLIQEFHFTKKQKHSSNKL